MSKNTQFPCQQCGADLKFAPGTNSLKCPYCGSENEIPAASRGLTPDDQEHIRELDYDAYLRNAAPEGEMQEINTVKCQACGAETTLPPNTAAAECPFCGTSIVITTTTTKQITPSALLPFKVTLKEAQEKFQSWVKGLWFAPNKLKKTARLAEGLKGLYLPHWTYDANTSTNYAGERGEHYYVTEMRTVTRDGKQVTESVQVQKTRWYPAKGRVHNTFDDVVVPASDSLPRQYTQALEPWDLHALAPYDDQFLSGFRAESYSVSLQQGFEFAKKIMEPKIEETIRKDIGGDEQRIGRKDTAYSDITFKHILLPLWISAYRYNDKIFRFLVNARTGEVQGERPWSWIKIAFAVLVGIGIVVGFILLFGNNG
ncbi:hypothetical protein U14_04600 [Candidatus Moduliflexus flocculans]|uniref:Primosomal protein N' (Replication factor Y)-superfamily II helicase n=1 Tax=Candidatus Moduliflexus flocculans TaxID=1499966 RepID=A0A0S6W0U4_9BACT|nr:hypothetical protein U14_04600 [Candidatus Moduliflexus flocculans]